mmetsp:Transcript_12631/g.39300  ORF Transcript_12631/g.39300 Transcript_12631/m.39300 type:complete len:224 (-) Transcript_12631:161-832(-)
MQGLVRGVRRPLAHRPPRGALVAVVILPDFRGASDPLIVQRSGLHRARDLLPAGPAARGVQEEEVLHAGDDHDVVTVRARDEPAAVERRDAELELRPLARLDVPPPEVVDVDAAAAAVHGEAAEDKEVEADDHRDVVAAGDGAAGVVLLRRWWEVRPSGATLPCHGTHVEDVHDVAEHRLGRRLDELVVVRERRGARELRRPHVEAAEADDEGAAEDGGAVPP